MTHEDVPRSHPRYISLMTRERIVAGMEAGVTSPHGLLAQGRGEAFDYLIGEKTQAFALESIRAAAALLLLAEAPVLSINGNVVALAAKEVCELAELVNAKIEVNIFHSSKEREQKIEQALLAAGAKEVLMPQDDCVIEGLDSNRRRVNPAGIYQADVVFVPLEDGDRCEILEHNSKKVITVDLNPSSRTSMTASVSIVDNLVRIWEPLKAEINKLKDCSKEALQDVLASYDKVSVLSHARKTIVENFLET